MENSRRQELTLSLQLASLGHHASFLQNTAVSLWRLQQRRATLRNLGPEWDTREFAPEMLAWEIAQTAQSCAALAKEMQMFAERLCDAQTISAGLTCRQLFVSAAILHDLLRLMLVRYRQALDTVNTNLVPCLSTHLAEEILSQLDHGQAITMVEYTINTESQEMSDTADVGGTK